MITTPASSPPHPDLDDLLPAALGEELVAVFRGIDAQLTWAMRLAYRFHRSGLAHEEGWRRTADWIASRCRLRLGDARDLLGLGENLWRLPLTEAALLAGELCFQNAALLWRLAEAAGYEAVLGQEEILVEKARELSPSNFRRVCQHFRAMVDPDGFLEDARHAHELRYLQVSSTLEGVTYLKGRFDPEAGVLLQAALNSVSPRRCDDDDRSPGNRRADGLLDIVRMALDSGALPEVAGERPHVTLTVSAEALAGVPGAPPATIGNDIPVPVETAQRLLCDSLVVLMPLDRAGNPLNLGRTRRTVSPRQRRALNVRDRGCRFPGCDRPWWWTDAHHLQAWEAGGPSDLENLVLLCRHHHVLVHEGGWRIGWNDERGGLFAIPPERPKPRLSPSTWRPPRALRW